MKRRATKRRPSLLRVLRSLGACDEAMEWAHSLPAKTTAQAAWDACPRSDWLLWLIGRTVRFEIGDVEHKRRVACAAEIAREVLPIFEKRRPGDVRIRECIETVERWTRGEATREQVIEARDRAWQARRDAYAAAYAAYAADAAAYAAYADAAAYAAYAAYAAAYAAYAARARMRARCAEIVRKHYPKPPRLSRKARAS